jgi:hypothetical protein
MIILAASVTMQVVLYGQKLVKQSQFFAGHHRKKEETL